jgi:hypothetical protein
MFDNPNGARLTMEVPVHPGLGSAVRLFGNHPCRDRPAGL